MRTVLKNFPKQFEYEPEVINKKKLKKFSKFIIAGMGGSHLAADLLKIWKPQLDLVIHSDYGLPMGVDTKKTLVIACSYSGNTEEALDSFITAGEQGMARAVITTGGELLERAKAAGVPYIQLPATGIQPRSALGFIMKASLKMLQEEEAVKEITGLSKTLAGGAAELFGKGFAQKLKGLVPVIYTSRANRAIAYNWKIKFNETGKVPAFYGAFPELNHNEMTSVAGKGGSAELAKHFYYIFLVDPVDDRRVQKRMEVMAKMYQNRMYKTEIIPLAGRNAFEFIFNSLLAADWTSFYLAEAYGSDPEHVPMLEDFKKLINR